MNKESRATKLEQGQIITIKAIARIDGEVKRITFDAMVYDESLDAKTGELLGIHVLPVTTSRRFLGSEPGSHQVCDARDIHEMGLGEAFGAFIHMRPILIKADFFDKDPHRSPVSAALKGNISNHSLLKTVLQKAVSYEEKEQMERLSILELGTGDMLGGLPKQERIEKPRTPANKPAAEPPKPGLGKSFEKAVLDMNIEDAARPEIGLIVPFLAERLPNPDMIKEGHDVQPITTMRQLEWVINNQPETLKAFFGIGPKTYEAVLEGARKALKRLNDAIESGEFTKESEYIFEAPTPA